MSAFEGLIKLSEICDKQTLAIGELIDIVRNLNTRLTLMEARYASQNHPPAADLYDERETSP